MEKVKDQDQLSREQIVENLKQNFFVEASAGSGKTTSLVYRMVALIESGVPVDKICTITFTKAAANEFFERFQNLLSIRSGDTPDRSDSLMAKRTNESKKRCQEALANIDLCFLGTIDSFCNMIAHEMPAELKIPSSSAVISKEEFKQIVKKEYNKILKDDEHKLHELSVSFNNAIEHPFDAFVCGISKISDLRNLEVIYDPSLSNVDFDTYFTLQDKAKLLEIMTNLTSPDDNELYKNDGTVKKDIERIDAKKGLENKLKNLKQDLNNWSIHLSDLKYAFKDIKNMDVFIDEAENTSIADYIYKKTPGSNYSFTDAFKQEYGFYSEKLEKYKYSIYFHFVLSVLDEVNESLKKKGKFQFFDFLLYLRNAFKESALGDRVLIDHIYERHSYFLLDESQDTNPLQTEMFFYLTSTKNDSDWRKMEPIEKSLFIVGDPKQSIYGFRGADVKAYLDNKKIFKDKDELLVLTKNYRSHANLKEWFNSTFNEMLNYTDALHKEFALEHIDIPIEADDKTKGLDNKNPSVLEGVYRYLVHGSTSPKLDCVETAQLIVDAVNNKQIYRTKYNPTTKKMEPYLDDIKYSDFLVVPFSSKMADLIATFNDYNIPVIVEGQMNFASAPTFNTVLNYLYILKEPNNKVALTNLLSDLYGINDLDIIQMLNDGFDLDISNTSLETIQFTNQNYGAIISSLNNLYKKTLRLSFSSTMEYILNDKETNIFSTTSAKDMEYIYFLIEKIKEGEETGSISTLEQLKNYVNLFISSGDEQRTIRFSDKVNRVKISNLHKVKGLQAPIVILAKPTSKSQPITSYIDYTASKPNVKFKSIGEKIGEKNVTYVETAQFNSEEDKWLANAEAEHDRLAYVGATRAESALIVCENCTDKVGYWAKLISHISSDRSLSIPPTDKESPMLESVSLGEYHINEDCHKQSLDYISPSQSRLRGRNGNKDEIDDAIYEEPEDKSDSTTKGTIIHKLMECIVSSKNAYDVEDLIKTILSDYGYKEEYDKMLHNVASKILNGGFQQVNSSLHKDVLKTLLGAKKTWCEVPFSYQSQKGNIVSGIIDVMYLDQDDKYHIIDYKTNVERDVSVLEKEYAGQLDQYRYALKKMGIDADAHIYHIDL